MTMTEVAARPTKRFFVEMLTRDIELEDAILDLLDNCIDGILRVAASRDDLNPRKPYEGFKADIVAKPAEFTIIDNCGGIPQQVAVESAFMFGRPDERDANLKTVGMYGIGMKRAIFKMGRSATVTSQPPGRPFQVAITEEWITDDNDWSLELAPAADTLPANGTAVHISSLHRAVSREFDSTQSGFLSRLQRTIARLYSLIIRKGFEVTLNGNTIEPIDFRLMTDERSLDTPIIRPYLFKAHYGAVEVELAVGFYRPLPTEEELDNEAESPRASSHQAGWTVICNDRVVLYGDRSLVTGWGRATVPRFHNQFMAIAGVVVFESTDSLALPLNTTKRGLDTSSDVYLRVLDYMQEGTQVFTSFTNRWKARENETYSAFKAAGPRPFRDVGSTVPDDAWTEVRRVKMTGGEAFRFTPNLPKPEDRVPCHRITFTRTEEAIRTVAVHFFDDPSTPPKDVGARAFDEALMAAGGEIG